MEEISSFIRAEKPRGMTDNDFIVMCIYLADTSREHPFSRLSQEEIAERSGLSRKRAGKSIKHLSVPGTSFSWLKKQSGKRRYNSNFMEVLYENLPKEIPEVPLIISGEARQCVEIHASLWKEHLRKYTSKRGRTRIRKLRADYMERWAPVYQRQINTKGLAAVVDECNEFKRVAFDSGDGPKQRSMQMKFLVGPQGFPWAKVQVQEERAAA